MLVCSHMGLGDQLMLIPAITKMTESFDILLTAFLVQIKTLSQAYFGLPVKFLFIRDNWDLAFDLTLETSSGEEPPIRDSISIPEESFVTADKGGNFTIIPGHRVNRHISKYFRDLGYYVLFCGQYHEYVPAPFYATIYGDLGLNWYFDGPMKAKLNLYRNHERELECYRRNDLEDKEYIFVHTSTQLAGEHFPRLEIDPEKKYYHPNINITPWNYFWEGKYKNVFDYALIIEKASEIHVVDSSFFCLALLLNLSAKKLVVYPRPNKWLNGYLKDFLLGNSQGWVISDPKD